MILVQPATIVSVKHKNSVYKFTPILSLEKGCMCKTTSHPFTMYSRTGDAVVPAYAGSSRLVKIDTVPL